MLKYYRVVYPGSRGTAGSEGTAAFHEASRAYPQLAVIQRDRPSSMNLHGSSDSGNLLTLHFNHAQERSLL
jgi:hypothetical protein